MAVETGFAVFFDLPCRDATLRAAPGIPLVTKPPGSAAPPGMPYDKRDVAVCRDFGQDPLDSKIFDPVQRSAPGWPELDFIDEDEKIDSLADVRIFDPLGSHPVILLKNARLFRT